jgi:two-component system chemotaxis response regulator CheB
MKILLADGSAVYKKMFTKAASEVRDDIVVTYAANGDEALEAIRRQDYDIVIIDAELQKLTALALLQEVLRAIPKALVLVTARPSPTNSKVCAQALSAGAFDCMTKPIYDSYADNVDAIKSKMADAIRILLERRNKKEALPPPPVRKKKNGFTPEIVLIAASTGGPRALETLLSNLSGQFPVPILMVQHIPRFCTETLAGRLNDKSRLTVKVAQDGENVAAGTAYMAPGDMHMKLDAKNRIVYDNSPPIHGIRPAADVLFASVAESFSGSNVMAVVLTGMGQDGVKGLARLKAAHNCFCLAQSEATCVVYGMPRAVIEGGLADMVLDLEDMAREMEAIVSGSLDEDSK